jgi:hypothetical protein
VPLIPWMYLCTLKTLSLVPPVMKQKVICDAGPEASIRGLLSNVCRDRLRATIPYHRTTIAENDMGRTLKYCLAHNLFMCHSESWNLARGATSDISRTGYLGVSWKFPIFRPLGPIHPRWTPLLLFIALDLLIGLICDVLRFIKLSPCLYYKIRLRSISHITSYLILLSSGANFDPSVRRNCWALELCHFFSHSVHLLKVSWSISIHIFALNFVSHSKA